MAGGDSCELCGASTEGHRQVQRVGDRERSFCCTGCLNVYAILAESGAVTEGVDLRQTDVFQESLRLGLIAQAEAARPRIPEDAEVREGLYQVSGLWCTACGWLVEHALMREPGVVSAEVLFTSDLLKVKYCPQFVTPDAVPARVKALGYRATEYGQEREGERREGQDLLLRLGVAGAMWMNVMLFSLVIYASYWEHISPWAHRAVPFILMALSLPAVLYSAWPIHRLAFYGIRNGALRMEALITTGVMAAFLYSSVQAFRGGQHYYFDTACAIVTLVLTGKALERNAKLRSARAIGLLHRLLPRKARLWDEGREHFVAVESLTPGQRILVKPGERIPADGRVVEGHSSVDESVVTGESALRAKGPGDSAICGSLNAAGVLELEVTRTGPDSTLAQIIKAVESALASRSPLERAVDRVSRTFIPVVLGVALLTLAGGLLLHLGATESMLRAIAVLVIACPCALGIATPLATTAAVGSASHAGILIRDVQVLETFRKVEVLILDKTGTLTEGAFRLRECPGVPLDLVAALEARSEHPLAHAVLQEAQARGLDLPPASGVTLREGLGLFGQVKGQRVAVGNLGLMAEEGVDLSEALQSQAQGWQAEGLTVAFVAVEGASRGALAFGDRLRPEAAEVIRNLRSRGVHTFLLSGDSRLTTERLAQAAGVDEFRGEVPPAGKSDVVRAFQAQGKVVAMVGDGINDAPALAAADIGIALGSGADLARHTAPVVLMSESLHRIPETFALAHKALRVVKQNLFWAFAYNAAGISLAITGVLNPILAAGAMVLSSLSVIGNSLRLGASSRPAGEAAEPPARG